MQNKAKAVEYIKNKFPDAYCELFYKTDLQLLIATLMSAQTTDKVVNSVTPKLFSKYKNVFDFSNASLEELTSDISSVGLAKTKAKNIIELSKKIINDYSAVVPNKKEELLKLPGVGTKTANVFLSVLYNEPLMAVDTHVERVSKRLYFSTVNDSVEKVENKIYKLVNKEDIPRFHHQMIFFGRYHCTARNPKCSNCELTDNCRYFKEVNKSVKRNKCN